jgi:hypothetical protein
MVGNYHQNPKKSPTFADTVRIFSSSSQKIKCIISILYIYIEVIMREKTDDNKMLATK